MELLKQLSLDPVDLALGKGERVKQVEAVRKIMADVAERGDLAVVESCRKFDDPSFSLEQIRVTAEEMRDAARRVPAEQLAAIRRSIAQVREYQRHIYPANPRRCIGPALPWDCGSRPWIRRVCISRAARRRIPPA